MCETRESRATYAGDEEQEQRNYADRTDVVLVSCWQRCRPGQIFRELHLHPSNIGEAKGGVIGPNKADETDVNRMGNKMGKWDGKLTQNKEDKNSRSKRSATQPSSTPPFNAP